MVSITSAVSSAVSDYITNKLSSSSTSKTSLTNTLLKNYLDETSSDMVRSDKIFENMSIDMGGDSTSITKDQLDTYIKNAQDGTVNISDKQLSALTELQTNWNDITFNSSNSISYADIDNAGYSSTLLSIVPDASDTSSLDDLQSLANEATISAYSSIVKSAIEGLTGNSSSSSNNYNGLINSALGVKSNDSSSTLSKLSDLLDTLLGGTTDENDDTNANAIDTLTNLIAKYKDPSTVDVEA